MTGRESLTAELCDFIRKPEFPCVGAKSALGRNQIVTVTARDIGCPDDDRKILDALYDFIASYDSRKKMFTSFAVLFEGPVDLGEEAFERHLWARLSALHKLDAEKFSWAENVSNDPASGDFAFSLGAHAFFIVGLHPQASRDARRLPHPAMIFNLHEQFQDLRMRGQYQRIKETVLDRDLKAHGSINPMLAEHGAGSAARQYSGRKVEADWRCPFRSIHDEAH
jgi:hypothetical protein